MSNNVHVQFGIFRETGHFGHAVQTESLHVQFGTAAAVRLLYSIIRQN